MSKAARDDGHLEDSEHGIKKIRRFIEGKAEAELSADEMLQDAVLRNLEIIGEAVHRLSPGLKDAYPDVPWHKPIGMRYEATVLLVIGRTFGSAAFTASQAPLWLEHWRLIGVGDTVTGVLPGFADRIAEIREELGPGTSSGSSLSRARCLACRAKREVWARVQLVALRAARRGEGVPCAEDRRRNQGNADPEARANTGRDSA